MEKQMIHIHAKCNKFEIFEVVSADKAVARLRQIKGYSKNQKYFESTNDKLVVKTRIINPTLFAV